MPQLLPPQSLQVDPVSQAVAVAGYNWVALLPTVATDLTSSQAAPVLAALPSFYSPGHRPPQPTPNPSPTTVAGHPTSPATASADHQVLANESPSKAYASDEAWLRAQTDARRLEATWMTNDMGSIPEVMQHQQEQMQESVSIAPMPPAGLIRSICFVGKYPYD